MTKLEQSYIVEALILCEQGWTYRQMSVHFGCSCSTISGRLETYDCGKRLEPQKRTRKKNISNEQIAQLERVFTQEPQLTLEEVKEKLDFPIH